MKKGITSDDYVLVEGGTTTINVSGGVAYDSEDSEYTATAASSVRTSNWASTMSSGLMCSWTTFPSTR